MNNNKVSFIIAVNNEITYNECKFYIDNLIIPDEFNIEILAMRNSESITKAYNSCMNSTDAKYKVYLHQDVFIINKNFISEILGIFNDDSIGMIGVCGTKVIPKNAIWWEGKELVGKVYESHSGQLRLLSFKEIESYFEVVDGLDGLIMITQKDIKWREDIFDSWHFYDLSQCIELKKRGYKVVVANQKVPWCTHDCGIVNTMNGFYENRKKFLDNYKEFI